MWFLYTHMLPRYVCVNNMMQHVSLYHNSLVHGSLTQRYLTLSLHKVSHSIYYYELLVL